MAHLSRRAFLKGSAVTAGASVLTLNGLFGFGTVFAQDGGDDPQLMLNIACTAETFACTHYYHALQNAEALALTAQEQNWLRSFLDSELKHKQFLEANGATSLATEFYVPDGLFTDRALFTATSNTAENWFVAAYLAATRRLAELGNSLFAATTAQVAAVEAEHQALIRLMGGLQPSFQTAKEPLFFNPSEVVPYFTPFLEGGDGFVGPAPFPGEDAISEEVGDAGVINVPVFLNLTMGTAAMAEATPEMSATDGACMVMGRNTRIRSGAGTDFEQVGSLATGDTAEVTGQTTDPNGFTWYQISQGFVRGDVVTLTGNCTAIPMVSM
jgi:hypothetical protein